MAKKVIELMVDDIDGTEAVASVGLGWNGEWRELELSERNLAALTKSIDKYWSAGRPIRAGRTSVRGKSGASRRAKANGSRDPKAIRAWAHENGLAVPARGRIPRELEEQYNRATGV